MTAPFTPGVFGNFVDLDFILVGAVQVFVIVGIVVLAIWLANRTKLRSAGNPPAKRLETLAALHRAGTINAREYEEQRRRILTEL